MLNPDPSPFKPTIPTTAPFALPDWDVLVVHGPDAAAFLQAQLMNDVRLLADGRWHWSGWLTPKGRVRALFALLRMAPDRFAVVVPDMPAGELAEGLRRFVFRSKVVLDGDGGWRVAGLRGLDPPGAPDVAHADADGAWTLDVGCADMARALRMSPPGMTSAPDDAAAVAAWHADDLRFGLPRLAPAQREAFTPQMLSLDRLRAYSLAKGCYPGQEIVSRTHYLGQAKRELALLEGGPFSPGAELRGGDGAAVGTVASVAADGTLALAVLARDRPAGALRADVPAWRESSLRDGLQRPV